MLGVESNHSTTGGRFDLHQSLCEEQTRQVRLGSDYNHSGNETRKIDRPWKENLGRPTSSCGIISSTRWVDLGEVAGCGVLP